MTVDAGPVDAGPVDAGPRPPDAGPQQGPDAGAPDGGVAAPANNCAVASGPSYTPTGSVPVSNSGGRKSAAFSMAATFSTAAATGATPSCCEVRQFIKWDARYAASKGGPPHSGFPASTPAGTWIEDRDTADTRYGHRSGVHSAPSAGCGDEYLLGGRRNQASGDTYCGSDNPGAPSARVGSYQFQLKVIDSCTGAERATSSIITVNWG